jgi:hypothetical protein
LNPDNQILDILEKKRRKNRLERFIQNTNTQALKLLKRSPDKINWFNLSLNNNSLALDLLEKKYP